MPEKFISIVDDDPLTLGATERLLKARGFVVRAFLSAEAFLEDATARKSACLLLDIDLGGISGIALSQRLADEGSPIPIVFITGVPTAGVREEAMATRPVAFLRKPFPARELFEAIAVATA